MIKEIKEEDGALVLEFDKDADIGLLNALVERLNRRENVSFTAFKKVHPYLDNPSVIVKVKKGDAKQEVIGVIDEMLSFWKGISQEFE